MGSVGVREVGAGGVGIGGVGVNGVKVGVRGWKKLRSEGVGIGGNGAGEGWGRMGFGARGVGSGISLGSRIGGRNLEPYGLN